MRPPKTFSRVYDELKEFEIFPGGEELAVAAARNFQYLRRMGLIVRKTVDCLIATFCIETDYPLLHRDRDFDPFEIVFGLRVIHA